MNIRGVAANAAVKLIRDGRRGIPGACVIEGLGDDAETMIALLGRAGLRAYIPSTGGNKVLLSTPVKDGIAIIGKENKKAMQELRTIQQYDPHIKITNKWNQLLKNYLSCKMTRPLNVNISTYKSLGLVKPSVFYKAATAASLRAWPVNGAPNTTADLTKRWVKLSTGFLDHRARSESDKTSQNIHITGGASQPIKAKENQGNTSYNRTTISKPHHSQPSHSVQLTSSKQSTLDRGTVIDQQPEQHSQSSKKESEVSLNHSQPSHSEQLTSSKQSTPDKDTLIDQQSEQHSQSSKKESEKSLNNIGAVKKKKTHSARQKPDESKTLPTWEVTKIPSEKPKKTVKSIKEISKPIKSDQNTITDSQQTLNILRQNYTTASHIETGEKSSSSHFRWVASDYENDDFDEEMGFTKVLQTEVTENEFDSPTPKQMSDDDNQKTVSNTKTDPIPLFDEKYDSQIDQETKNNFTAESPKGMTSQPTIAIKPKTSSSGDVVISTKNNDFSDLPTWDADDVTSKGSSLEWAAAAYHDSRETNIDFVSIPPQNPDSVLTWDEVKQLPVSHEVLSSVSSTSSRMLVWKPKKKKLKLNRNFVFGSVEDWFIPETEMETSKIGLRMAHVRDVMIKKDQKSRQCLQGVLDILSPLYNDEDIKKMGGNSKVNLAIAAAKSDNVESKVQLTEPETLPQHIPSEYEATIGMLEEEDIPPANETRATQAEIERNLITQEVLLKTTKTIRKNEKVSTTLQEEDEDRANSTEIRRSFQGVRTVSNTLEIAKELLQMLNNLKLSSYAGFQTYRAALLVLANISRASTIDTLYETMLMENIKPDTRMYSLILSVWCRRSLRKTIYYINEMLIHNVNVDYKNLNYVIHAATWASDIPEEFSNGRTQLSIIHKLVSLSHDLGHTSEETVLPLLKFVNSFEEGLSIFKSIQKNCSVTHKSIQAVLQLCINLGEPDKAEEFFLTMTHFGFTPKAPQWRALLRCYESSGNDIAIVKRWDDMISDDIVPTPQAYSILLGVYQRRVTSQVTTDVTSALHKAEQHFLKAITTHGYQHNMLIWNSMCQIYCDLYCSNETVENQELGLCHLAKMKDQGLSANDRTKALYKRLTGLSMTSLDALGDVSDDKTLAKYLRIRCRLPNRVDQRTVRRKGNNKILSQYVAIIENSLQEHEEHLQGAATFTTLISLYGNVGLVDKAIYYYNKVKSLLQTSEILKTEYRSAATAMMSTYTTADSAIDVIKIWVESSKLGVLPDNYMCTQLVWGMAKGGVAVDKQLALVQHMLSIDIPLDISSIVALISSCVTYSDATDILKKFSGFSPILGEHPALLGSMLKPCAVDRDLKSAEIVFKMIPAPRNRDWIELLNVCKECGDIINFEKYRQQMSEYFTTSTSDQPDLHVVFNIAISTCYTTLSRLTAPAENLISTCLRVSNIALKELGTEASPGIINIYKSVRKLCGEDPQLSDKNIKKLTTKQRIPLSKRGLKFAKKPSLV